MPISKKGPLRVAVLGQGRSGLDIHCHYLKTAPRKFEIIAIADLLRERRKRAAEEMGCATYADYRDLLARDDLDLVVNALPSHLHPEATIASLEAGHHTICEKPLAWSVTELDKMIAAARANRRRLLPFQQSRNAPQFQKIFSNQNCSATKRGLLPVPSRAGSASSKKRTTARYCSTKSARWHPTCRQRCFAPFRSRRSIDWAAPSPLR